MKKLCCILLTMMLAVLPLLACAESEKALQESYAAAKELLAAGDLDAAYAEYVRAAEMGYAPAMYALGYYLDLGTFGKGTPDKEAAVQWWLQAAELGDSKAMQALGHYYAHEANPVDFTQAEQWLLKAAEGGQMGAVYNLGIHYANGDFGGAPDFEKALDCYVQAAEAGNDNALGSAIDLCANGKKNEEGEVLLAPDHEKLYAVVTRAYENGNRSALVYNWLGWIYAGKSDVMEADYARAQEILLAGAELGAGYCMAQLGIFYRDGLIGTSDKAMAEAWFVKAVEAGYMPAQEMLDKIEAE